jgi:hypothetical protein
VDTFWTVLGSLLIAAILWEVFNDLFHPAGTGSLSDWVGRMLFEGCKRAPRVLPLAGPVALVTIIALWVAGLVIGFALVYYRAYPGDFRTSTGTVPSASSRLPASLYFSFETLITLGYGDIVPQSKIIRFVAAAEGLVGFGLLTASVSSIVLLYPALSRMRLLARGVSHIVDAERQSGISLAATGSEVTLSSLARDVTHARIDLVHFPLVYYFAAKDPEAAVPTWVREIVRIAGEACEPGRPEAVRLAGNVLDGALHEFAAILDVRFLHTKSRNRDVIFAALVKDHLLGHSTADTGRLG